MAESDVSQPSGGEWLGALTGFGQMALSRSWNKASARRARKFTRYMSNTAHQRNVRDLRAAGLNPILSAVRGGASSPSAPMAAPASGDIMSGAASGAAISTARLQRKLIQSQINKTDADTGVSGATEQKIISETKRWSPFGEVGGRIGDFLKGIPHNINTGMREFEQERNRRNELRKKKWDYMTIPYGKDGRIVKPNK